jgi:hypothetical protein
MDTLKRREDATSDDTLEDLEDDEFEVDEDDSDGLSPDGDFDDEEDLKDADPI